VCKARLGRSKPLGPPAPRTWHYGLVARYWDEFNSSGPEIDYFRRVIEGHGEPALDAGCGTGRLLLPYLRAGLDVDGCDVSADMLALCRQRAEAEGLSPNLYAQALHELDLPRRYRTIVVCGSFGLGATHEEDFEALRRLHRHLEPGGVLALDNEVPYANPRQWAYWPKEQRRELPQPWSAAGERERARNGDEYALRGRLIALDPLRRSAIREIRAELWRDGTLIREEEHTLTLNLYFTNELVLLLERAGFDDVVVRGGYDDAEPTADHDFVVFHATKERSARPAAV
jgi:SAM-dependent methyltransferase